jgi:uncharacterized repeat protein (TIGR01451 family)
VGGAIACGTVRLVWTDNSTNETGFKIFKDGSLVYTAPASSPATNTGGTLSYDYSPGDNNTHNYSIASTNGFGDSATVNFTNNAFASTPCAANLGNSDKDITAVNGINTPVPNACNSTTDALPASTVLKLGDTVSFQINLCNTFGTIAASGITLTDSLTNLIVPTAGFAASYNGSALTYDGAIAGTCTPAGVNHYCASGTAPGQTLTFNLTSAGDNIAATLSKPLTFNAKINVVGTASISRFQNSYLVNYNSGTFNYFTPYIPVYVGSSSPTIHEVP